MLGARNIPNTIEMRPEFDLKKLKSCIWQSAVRSDIRSTFDTVRYQVGITDHRIGRLIVTCDIFFSFRSMDIFIYLEIHSIASKNKISKLALNKEDIERHLAKDLLSFLFKKDQVIRAISGFLSRLRFDRASLYYKPVIVHVKNKHENYVFVNRLRGSTTKSAWLEKRHQEQQIVGQYVKRFDKMFVILTVFKVVNLDGFEVEIYVPRIQKRFFFQIFNEEMLEIDSKTVQQIYQIGSNDIKVLAELHRGDYKKIKESIFEQMVVSELQE